MQFDPVRIEIYWAQLISAVNDAATVLLRTSFSGMLRDCRDFACSLFDARGHLLVQDQLGTPGLSGPTPGAMRHFLAAYPPSEFSPGDVMITNDPWKVSGHLADTTVLTPLHEHGELLGFAMCVAHQLDIGGRGVTIESRDVHEEGLWLPILKLYRRGQLNDDLMAIIRHNVRMPEMVVGDIQAQIASNDIAGRGLRRLANDIGIDTLPQLSDEIANRTEAATRAAVERIPDGDYGSELLIDGQTNREGRVSDSLRLRVTIRVRGSSLIVDFAGTSPQVPVAINACLNGLTMAYVLMGLKCVLDPELPMNEGFLRPITLIAPEGCLVNPRYPAPVQARQQVAHFMVEVILNALAIAMPDRVIAGCGSVPAWNQQFEGVGRAGRAFNHFFPLRGGLGAGPDRDGTSCLSFPTNVATLPVELLEADVPILVERKEMLPDSAGPGRFRGGLGQEVIVSVSDGELTTGGPVLLSCQGGRFDFGVPGLHGGRPAPRGEVHYNGKAVRSGAQWVLKPGDRVVYKVPGGGGFYDPFTRDPYRVLADVQAGLVTVEAARRDYGVVITAAGKFDDEATECLRKDAAR